MQDADFVVIDRKEGKGKLAGKCGSLICQDDVGRTFAVKLKMPDDVLQKVWNIGFGVVGKTLVVQFQDYTS